VSTLFPLLFICLSALNKGVGKREGFLNSIKMSLLTELFFSLLAKVVLPIGGNKEFSGPMGLFFALLTNS